MKIFMIFQILVIIQFDLLSQIDEEIITLESSNPYTFNDIIDHLDDQEKQIKPKEKKFVIAGGVAANREIRKMLIQLCKDQNYEPIFPPIELCGDNAAMIAMVGLEKYKLKQFSNLDYPAKPRWALDENAKFLKGAGVKL